MSAVFPALDDSATAGLKTSRSAQQSEDTYRWGTVTQASPLRVRLDGDTEALPFAPASLAGSLSAGDRVWVQMHNRQAILLGTPSGGGTGGEVEYLPLTGGTLTGPLDVEAALTADGITSSLPIKVDSSSQGDIQWTSAGVQRFTIRYNASAASMQFIVRNTSGTIIYTPITIALASGEVQLASLLRTGSGSGKGIDNRSPGISYSGTTYPGGGSNQVGFRWASPNLTGSVDNLNGMTVGTVSARKYKTAITGMAPALALLGRLRPVTYTPKEIDGTVVSRERHNGLVADEVDRVLPSAVIKDAEGQAASVNYTALVPVLVKAVQELTAKVAALEAKLAQGLPASEGGA